MKTKSFYSALIAFVTTILFFSCRHESPPESCESIGFKLSILKTDALLNASNGTITATATGGKGFQYSLNGSEFKDSGNFTGLAAFGSYKVVGRNSTGCTDTVDVTIGSFDPCAGVTINVTTTKVDASPNQSNGSITVTATGGNNITYSLNGGPFQSSGIFSNLAAGSYTIAAKSVAGCIGITQTTIGTNDPCSGVTLTVTSTTVQPGVNLSNGSITATASGGTGFTYSLNNGAFQASGTFSGLAAGNYTLTAKNSNGCTGVTSVSLTNADPCAAVTVSVSTTTVRPTNTSSNGSISATATGGTGFTYSLNNGTFQASGTFSNLAAGNYTVTAKNSNGCSGVTTVSLVSIDPCAGVTVAVSTTTVQPSTGLSNGSITATATGGTGYTYSINGGAFQTSGTFSNLVAGNYTITAKNSNGCTGVTTVALGNANPCAGVTITISSTTVNPTIGQSNGSITSTATGGTGFTYSLNNGVFQASGTFSGLAAGSYTITAKNSNGCTGASTVTLTNIDPCAGITVAVTATTVNPSTGLSNGSITASATGGTGFTYSLNNAAFQSSGTFSNLAAGTYTITAKNSNGCIGAATFTLTNTDPCAGLTVLVTTTTVDPSTGMSNGSIIASATGGTGFTYSLNSGAFQTSGTFSNLAAGTYTITAKNSNGCIGVKQVTLTAISPCTNTNITLTVTIVNTTPCVTPANNGSITVTASGSTGFTYNINGGAYQTSNIFASLNAGNYLIAVKDVNGCTKTLSVAVAVVAPGPLFSQMRTLITTRCSGSGCHMNGTTTAGYNFDADCSIVTNWSKINGACITLTLKQMPISPQPPLTTTEKQIITNWVNAGHRYTD
jgi:large repetitive protein